MSNKKEEKKVEEKIEKEEKKVEGKVEKKNEVKEEKVDKCSCEEESCSCECDCGDYTFESVHKPFSLANILSISLKVLALIMLLFALYSFVMECARIPAKNVTPNVILPMLAELASLLLAPLVLAAAGEALNLLNRIKEAIY